MSYATVIDGTRYVVPSLRELLAKASPLRSGDVLAGVAAESEVERAVAQIALAEVPLADFLQDPVVPYETDEVTRLILDSHDPAAFARVASLTVGGFREWLLSPAADGATLAALAPGITPEMAAAVSKIMRLQDLIAVAAKCRVITRFRNSLGLPGRLSTRLQPNHPTDDSKGIAASVLDGLLLASGDAVIGINPVTDNVGEYIRMTRLLDDIRRRLDIPTQTCVLGPCDHRARGDRAGRAGRPRLSVHRRHREGQRRVRRHRSRSCGRRATPPSRCGAVRSATT
jgi:ethanolamine ammonia-lyase large subunit